MVCSAPTWVMRTLEVRNKVGKKELGKRNVVKSSVLWRNF